MTDIDLNFIATKLDRIIGDVAALRDDVHVLSAIVIRLDTSQSAMLEEMRAAALGAGRF